MLLRWFILVVIFNTSANEAEGTFIIYSFIEYTCYDLKYIDGVVNCQNTWDNVVPRMQQWLLDIPQ